MMANPKGKMRLQELADHLRRQVNHPATVRLHNRQQEAFRELARDIIGDFQKRMGAAMNLDPQAFAKVPDDVVEGLILAGERMKAYENLPDARLRISFSSEVTVNGEPVPDNTNT